MSASKHVRDACRLVHAPLGEVDSVQDGDGVVGTRQRVKHVKHVRKVCADDVPIYETNRIRKVDCVAEHGLHRGHAGSVPGGKVIDRLNRGVAEHGCHDDVLGLVDLPRGQAQQVVEGRVIAEHGREVDNSGDIPIGHVSDRREHAVALEHRSHGCDARGIPVAKPTDRCEGGVVREQVGEVRRIPRHDAAHIDGDHVAVGGEPGLNVGGR